MLKTNIGVASQEKDLLRLAVQYKVLTAASLSRIFQHIKEDGEPFAFLSAFKSRLSREENKKRQQDLQSSVRSKGYGAIRVIGQWVAEDDWDDAGDPIVYREFTLFIMGISKDEAVALAKKYDQDAVLWGTSEKDAAFYDKSGGKIGSFSSISTQDIGKLFSEYKGKKFKFSALEYVPHGYLSGLSWLASVKLALAAKLGSEDLVDSQLIALRVAKRASHGI
jgi:hypothetical protein